MIKKEVETWFTERTKFILESLLDDRTYIKGFNHLTLGYIEEYEDKSIIHYKAGAKNQKWHNIIISDEYDCYAAVGYLSEVFKRKYNIKDVIVSNIPNTSIGKGTYYKTQELTEKKIPKDARYNPHEIKYR